MDGINSLDRSAKVHAAALEGLKAAMAGPGEQRLFRSGKLPGLFPVRNGVHGEAANFLLAEKLLEVIRREEKGKIAFDWVRITPAGVDYLHRHESPRAVLAELRDALAVTRAGVPIWLDELRQELAVIGGKLADDVERMTAKLDALAHRVDNALRRADAAGPGWPKIATASVPWALHALAHLDKRRETGMPGQCPLPELFAAVRHRDSCIGIGEFQDGLRQLAESKALRLLPFSGPTHHIPEPEYAIPWGKEFLYFAKR